MVYDGTTGYVSAGWYVAAIILEDFPPADITMGGQSYTTTDPLSSVPVQV